MAKARLAYTNLLTVSGVVISSSSEATGYVDDNLASAARWKRWRSTTTTGDQWVKFDLGASKNFQVLAAITATLHSGGTLRAQANASDVWTDPTVNDLLTPASPDFTAVIADWLPAVKSLRWIRFYFTNVGAVSAFVELGSVFAGTYIEPLQSIAPGFAFTPRDPSVVRQAIGGQISTVTRAKYHEASGLFRLQSAAARDDLRVAFQTNGITVPCLLTADANVPGLTFYGRVRELAATHRPQMVDRWDVPFQFIEDVA